MPKPSLTEHTGKLGWRFDVDIEAMYPKDIRKTLGQWFLAMAGALGATKLEADTLEQLGYNNQAMSDYTQLVESAIADAEKRSGLSVPSRQEENETDPTSDEEIDRMVAEQIAKGKVR